MKMIFFKVFMLSAVITLTTGCDVNKFLDDLAQAMEEPADQGNGDTRTQQQTPPQADKDIKRETERTQTVETRSDATMEEIIVDLDLSNEQLAQYRTINSNYTTKIEAVKKSNADTNTKAKEIKALRNAQEREVYDLLTPAQVEKFKMIQEEKASEFKKR